MKKASQSKTKLSIPINPIKRRSVPEEIINQIKLLVDAGHLVPGSKFPTERELAQKMNVSRPSLREALGALSLLGVIENRPGSGTFLSSSVKQLPSDSFGILFLINKNALIEIFNARKIIEGPVAALAADHKTEEDLRAMEIALDGMKRNLFQIDRFLKHEYQFHKAVITAAGNRIIADLMEKLYRILKETRNDIYHKYSSSLELFQEHDYQNHKLIYEAIKAGNGRLATRSMMNHLRDFECWLNSQQNGMDGGDKGVSPVKAIKEKKRR